MRYFNKKYILGFVLIVLILLIQFLANKQTNFTGTGNSMSNIKEYGIVAESNKYIVVSNFLDDFKLYYINKNTGEIKSIYGTKQNTASYLNVVDDMIYYNAKGNIHRYNIKTGRNELISAKNTYGTIIVENYIYTIKPNEDGSPELYQMNLDGKNKNVVLKDFNEICIYNNKIYFSNTKDNYSLYSCDLNGDNIKKISDMSIAQISINNDKIFVTDIREKGLYVMNIDGTNKHKLCDDTIQSINVTGDKVLFSNGSKLCLTDLNFSKVEVLAEGVITNINVIGNKILYRRPVTDKFGSNGLYVMDINERVELNASIDNILVKR